MNVKKLSWTKHLDFIIADMIMSVIAFVIAYSIRLGSTDVWLRPFYVYIFFTILLVQFLLTVLTNHYSGVLRRGYFVELQKTLKLQIVTFLVIIIELFITQRSGTASRIVVFIYFGLDFLLCYASSCAIKFYLLRHKKYEMNLPKAVLVTQAENLQQDMKSIQEDMLRNYEITAIFLSGGDSGQDKYSDGTIVGDIGNLYTYVTSNVVDEVMIFCDTDFFYKNIGSKVIDDLRNAGIIVNVRLRDLFEALPGFMVEKKGNMRFFVTSVNEVTNLAMATKRVVDIVLSIIGLIATGVLFIFLAPMIKISDPKGPVFFRQERIGRNGRPFYMYKFRSMYSDAEERKEALVQHNEMNGLMFKMDADPRILGSGKDGTKKGLGYWMRKLSLDEFPNSFSIFKGDMSVVGTRPPTRDEYDKYELKYKGRLAMRPGLTGMWQVSGRSDIKDFEDIVELDMEYIRDWSFSLDVKIMLKTFYVVIFQKGSK